MAFVLDTSVTMAWCFENEASPYSAYVLEGLRHTGAVVPAIWPFEVANVLLTGESRQRLTEAQTLHFVELLGTLPISLDDGGLGDIMGVLTLGREQGLSADDASYLELAARRGLTIATQDTRLRAAAERMGVMLA